MTSDPIEEPELDVEEVHRDLRRAILLHKLGRENAYDRIRRLHRARRPL